MALFTKGVDICKTLIICRTILSNQKSCGVLRFQECLAFRRNWQKQRMFLCHEFLGSKNNVLDLHLIWLGQVSFFHRHKFVQRDPPCRAVWWNRLAAVLIADSDRFSSEYAMLNRNKVGRLLFIQSVLEDGFMFTMWFRDFYWFLSFEMCVILCVEHFGDWLQNPSQLDVKTTLGRPGRQWHEKRASVLINLQTSGIFQLEIPQIQWLETDVRT